MMKKFCLRCGRLLNDGEQCSCRSDVKREKKFYPTNNFYSSRGWRSVSNYIRVRDFNMDRLQLYFSKYKPTNEIEKRIYEFVVDVNGVPRLPNGRLVVHHVVELEDDWSRRFDETNLLTLEFHVHEFIHQLYLSQRDAVQQLLFRVIATTLP